MSRKKRFFLGLLLLLLAPTAVLGLFAAYAYWDNLGPHSRPLEAWVDPPFVLPSGEAFYFVRFSGQKEAAEPAPETPLDVTFIVDVSGSMTESLPIMATAATEVLKELVATRPGLIRFALIRFDVDAEINTDWTGDPQHLYPGLNNTAPVSTGGTNPEMAFRRLDELFERARSDAKRVIVFYTDGIFGGMSPDEIVDRCEQLRDSGVDIYSVGPPVYGSAGIIYQMIDDPQRVFNPTNARDLAINFRNLAEGIVLGFGQGGQISNRLDGRHFSAPLEGTGWSAGAGGTVSLGLSSLPDRPSTYAHPLAAHSAGLWRASLDPAQLVFTDPDQRLHRITAEGRPAILVITWFTLFLALLPALVWMLLHIPGRRVSVPDEQIVLPELVRPSLPGRLPALPRIADDRRPAVPTLFIGLGGTGRRAIHATRADLKQAHLGHEGQPYRFLWIDLDVREATREVGFDDWKGVPVEELIAPPEIRESASYLPEPGRTPDHLSWFDGAPYRDASRKELSLADGTRGDRALARLALFEWLSRQGTLLQVIEERCKELMAMESADGTRQVIVFASPDGGVGSGWFLDIARLLHRIGRREQAAGAGFVPEIIGVLCDRHENEHPANRRALEMEIDTASLSGAYPQRVAYKPGDSLLDQTDAEAPYNLVFKTGAFDANSAAAQCSELCSALVERLPRSALLEQASLLDWRRPILVAAHALHVLPALVRDQVRCELFLRFMGPDVLLDVVRNEAGGFAPRNVSDEAASNHLREWARDEPPGTPWQLLLAAANNTSLVPALVKTLEAPNGPGKKWFANAFAVSLTHKLHGHADPEMMGWHREWMPGDAIATLRLLANRLEESVRPEIESTHLGARASHTIEALISILRSAADQLQRLVRELCSICEQVARTLDELGQLPGRLHKLSRRTFIDVTGDGQTEQWARLSLERWLGTRDTVSAIRQRLFITATVDGDKPRVVVRSCIDGMREFETADELARAVEDYSQLLASLVPAVKIEGTLSEQGEEALRSFARSLVDTQTRPRQVLVVMPEPASQNGRDGRALGEMGGLIPQPAHHGLRRLEAGDDHAAIRRIEMDETTTDGAQPLPGPVPLIEAAERAAELVRLRAERIHRIALPVFPPALRIALSHSDSFSSFARAYKAGHIVRRRDASDIEQWAFLDIGEFLTFESDQTLAAAAANYVWYIKSPPASFTPLPEGGSFALMERWLRERNYPGDDTLTQIAIDVYEK